MGDWRVDRPIEGAKPVKTRVECDQSYCHCDSCPPAQTSQDARGAFDQIVNGTGSVKQLSVQNPNFEGSKRFLGVVERRGFFIPVGCLIGLLEVSNQES